MLVIAPISDMVAHVAWARMKTLTKIEGESLQGIDTVELLPFLSPDSMQYWPIPLSRLDKLVYDSF